MKFEKSFTKMFTVQIYPSKSFVVINVKTR